MKTLIEDRRETYGHDQRAINKHSERSYRDRDGNHYILSRTLDGCPPFFEAFGPYRPEHEGVLPRLQVMGKVCWGEGLPWSRAVKAFCRELQAKICFEKRTTRREGRQQDRR